MVGATAVSCWRARASRESGCPRDPLPNYLKVEPQCPAGQKGAAGYTLNARLAGPRAERVSRPASTVLFYEGKGGVLEFRHDGRAGVVFADGHAALVDSARAKQLRWGP